MAMAGSVSLLYGWPDLLSSKMGSDTATGPEFLGAREEASKPQSHINHNLSATLALDALISSG